jgi:RNA polymerase sigma-70 factor (ECF subfamily)
MNRAQFETNILSLQAKFFRYALSVVKERELAKDVVQEVLMKLWDQRESLGRVEQLEAWCIRMIRNKALDKLKLKANKGLPLQQLEETRTLDAMPDKLLEQQNLMETIQRLLHLLPEKQQEIFRLRDLMGYDNKEIEQILGLDASQVKTNLFRARKTIRLHLHQLMDYGLENEKTAS